MTELRTQRLILREWRESDLEPFAALNADPRVMEHYASVLTREQSDASFRERILRQFDLHGYGPWVVEVPGVTPFAGHVGLLEHTFEASFTPCVEVGWRLAFPYWGHGYATEGARAALNHGFNVADLDEIVSFTSLTNTPSIAVMERLGMTRSEEFDHPRLLPGHRLQRHVLYRLRRSQWRDALATAGSAEARMPHVCAPARARVKRGRAD